MNECMLSKMERRAMMGKRLMTVCVMVLAMAALMCVPAFAEDPAPIDSIVGGVKQGASSIFELATDLVVPVAAAYMGWGIFSMIFEGQKGMESGKKKLLLGAIVIAGVKFAPTIADTISGWFDGVAKTTIFD